MSRWSTALSTVSMVCISAKNPGATRLPTSRLRAALQTCTGLPTQSRMVSGRSGTIGAKQLVERAKDALAISDAQAAKFRVRDPRKRAPQTRRPAVRTHLDVCEEADERQHALDEVPGKAVVGVTPVVAIRKLLCGVTARNTVGMGFPRCLRRGCFFRPFLILVICRRDAQLFVCATRSDASSDLQVTSPCTVANDAVGLSLHLPFVHGCHLTVH